MGFVEVVRMVLVRRHDVSVARMDTTPHQILLEFTGFKKALELHEGSALIANGVGGSRREFHGGRALDEARLFRVKEVPCNARVPRKGGALHPRGPLLNVGLTEGSDIQTREVLLTRWAQEVTRQSEEA